MQIPEEDTICTPIGFVPMTDQIQKVLKSFTLKERSIGGVDEVYLRNVVPTKTPPLRNMRVISAI